MAAIVRCMLCTDDFKTARSYLAHACQGPPPPTRLERARQQLARIIHPD